MLSEPGNLSMALIEAMPDGQGGWQPVPALMTEAEVVRYRRQDVEEFLAHKSEQKKRAAAR